MIETGSENLTYYFEDGVRVYPCRCGEIHKGDYAAYDYGHHNCLHDAPLLTFDLGSPVELIMCPLCGEVFHLDRVDSELSGK